MKTKLSPNRFYLSNIIFYTCLLAFPSAAAIEQVPQPKNLIDNDNEWVAVAQTESNDEESSPKLTGDEQIMTLINKLNKKSEQLERKNEHLEKENEHLKQKVAKFESILSMMISIEPKGEDGMTSFLSAVKGGQLGLAKQLKKRRANINAKEKDGDNALHLACYYSGSVAMVTWLLDVCKIDIETKGQYEKTPFLCAAEKGQLGIAKLLRQRGADIKAKSEYRNNAIHFACLYSGSVAMVEWLLDVCHISIETKGYVQKTPFPCAAQNGHLQIAMLLKKRGANIHAKDANGRNALHLACLFSGNVAMVTWLLDVCKLGKEIKGVDARTPFLSAAAKGQLAIAKLLKKRKANINAKEKDGDNALHLACYYSGSVAMVTWLLDVCKIDIETKGQYEKTPFLCAAAKDQLAIAQLLRQRGTNIHTKDKSGNSALWWAKNNKHKAMINYLEKELRLK